MLGCNNDTSFEASFVMEPMSVGLNVGLDMVNQKTDLKDTPVEAACEQSCPFGVKNTVVSHHMSGGFLKSLKYSDGSYNVSLLQVCGILLQKHYFRVLFS